ncbi:MAG: cobalamin-dependent protein [Gemmatimonadaceae bacterium]|nr:cobalamin-dependent protein [Gemmatimonadaceae bacterium]
MTSTLSPRDASDAARRTSGATLDAGAVERFVALLTGPDDAGAEHAVRDWLARGVLIETLYLDLFAPAAVRLGALWDEDACDFLQVTDALGRMHRVLHLLEPVWLTPAPEATRVGRALMACPAGEQHTLGLFLVADFFARDGWDVLVGPPLDRVGLLDAVTEQHIDVVGFSVGCTTRLPRLAHDIAHVRRASRNPHILVLVGGPPFVGDPTLVARVGADATAVSADGAPAIARALLARRSAVDAPLPAI